MSSARSESRFICFSSEDAESAPKMAFAEMEEWGKKMAIQPPLAFVGAVEG